jgi:L-fuculose-phosphate aldolase
MHINEAKRGVVSRIGQQLLEEELTRAIGGNVSTRTSDGTIAISPSGVTYPEIEPGDVPMVTMVGEQIRGLDPSSSETPMHTAIYGIRPETGGIVHSHSPYASTLAVLNEPI